MLLLGFHLKKTLREVAEMSQDEFELWIAFFRKHDPERRHDVRFAKIQALLSQKFWPQTCGYSYHEFMPAEFRDIEPDEEKEVERKAKEWAATCGRHH